MIQSTEQVFFRVNPRRRGIVQKAIIIIDLGGGSRERDSMKMQTKKIKPWAGLAAMALAGWVLGMVAAVVVTRIVLH